VWGVSNDTELEKLKKCLQFAMCFALFHARVRIVRVGVCAGWMRRGEGVSGVDVSWACKAVACA
jgi:hypothetical protein